MRPLPPPTRSSASLRRTKRCGPRGRTSIGCRRSRSGYHALVRNQLRPGADESRADAELAIGQNQCADRANGSDRSRGLPRQSARRRPVHTRAGPLAQLPATPPTNMPSIDAHPAVRAEAAAIETVQARSRAGPDLCPSRRPADGVQWPRYGQPKCRDSPCRAMVGAWRSRTGPSASRSRFRVLEGFAVNARKRVEAQNELAERARHEQAIQSVTTQHTRAQALMTAATESRETPPSSSRRQPTPRRGPGHVIRPVSRASPRSPKRNASSHKQKRTMRSPGLPSGGLS